MRSIESRKSADRKSAESLKIKLLNEMVLNKRSVSDFKKDKLKSPLIEAMPKEIDMEEAKEKDSNNLKQ